jgi:regulator of protease activity HflC (stomatin/prohibitin superfamily)
MALTLTSDLVTLLIEVFIVLIVLAILLSGIRILKEWERAPMLTLGRYRGLKGPGVIYIPPFISRVPFIISTRLQVVTFKTEQTLTRDNVPVNVDSVMYYQPVDLQKVVLGAERFSDATQLAAQTTLREVIGEATFDELLTEREKVGSIARGIIDSKTEMWGIKVTSVEIRDVAIPQALQEAMSRQAQAERERRARVTLAIAEFEAAQRMVDAANLYKDSDRAFQLRWMNIIYELGLQGKNTIMLLPANIPAAGPASGMPVYGIYGIQDLAKMAKQTVGPETSQKAQQKGESAASQANGSSAQGAESH